MAGEVFKPKRVLTRGAIKEMVGQSQMGETGKVDFEQTDQQAIEGVFTRRVSADPPGGFIFVCACGHKRRVTGEETNFTCERGGVSMNPECDIEWKRLRKKTGEVDENGDDVYEEVATQETVEVPDEFTGKKRKVKIDVPVFEGRRIGEVKRAEFARRKAAGEEVQAQPTNTIVTTQVIQDAGRGSIAEHLKPEKKKA